MPNCEIPPSVKEEGESYNSEPAMDYSREKTPPHKTKGKLHNETLLLVASELVAHGYTVGGQLHGYHGSHIWFNQQGQLPEGKLTQVITTCLPCLTWGRGGYNPAPTEIVWEGGY